MIEFSSRLSRLPPYPFKEVDAAKAQAKARGIDLIDLGVGDPDLPTPEHIILAGEQALRCAVNYRYPTYAGMLTFREAVGSWYEKRFGVKLKPETEVLTLIGAKEGIGHIPLAFINPGDVVLVPSPGYPVYAPATIFAGGTPHLLPLKQENDFLPDFDSLEQELPKKTKLLFLNYPNNPTGSCATLSFFSRIVEFAAKHNIIVVHDNPYSEMYYDDSPQPSFLEVDGAKEVGIEVHSLSKTYNMTGWRIGMACGNSEILKGLLGIKSNLDSGAFQAVQEAGIAALTGSQDCVQEMRDLYQDRREVLVNGLNDLGWNVPRPGATFYVWIPVPASCGSSEFARILLEEAGVVVTPGVGFGQYGEGYIRMALTVDKERLEEAVERIRSIEYRV